jgi:hypothetical protein
MVLQHSRERNLKRRICGEQRTERNVARELKAGWGMLDKYGQLFNGGLRLQILPISAEAVNVPITVGTEIDLPVALMTRLAHERFKAGALPEAVSPPGRRSFDRKDQRVRLEVQAVG